MKREDNGQSGSNWQERGITRVLYRRRASLNAQNHRNLKRMVYEGSPVVDCRILKKHHLVVMNLNFCCHLQMVGPGWRVLSSMKQVYKVVSGCML